MTIGWPKASCMLGATSRAMVSAEPPAPKFTIIRTGFEGQAGWACALPAAAISAVVARAAMARAGAVLRSGAACDPLRCFM